MLKEFIVKLFSHCNLTTINENIYMKVMVYLMPKFLKYILSYLMDEKSGLPTSRNESSIKNIQRQL